MAWYEHSVVLCFSTVQCYLIQSGDVTHENICTSLFETENIATHRESCLLFQQQLRRWCRCFESWKRQSTPIIIHPIQPKTLHFLFLQLEISYKKIIRKNETFSRANNSKDENRNLCRFDRWWRMMSKRMCPCACLKIIYDKHTSFNDALRSKIPDWLWNILFDWLF